MDKAQLRKVALDRRNQLDATEREEKSVEILTRLEQLDVFKASQNILSFFSQKAEVQTIDWMKRWLPEKNIYLPKLTSGGIFVAASLTSFEALEVNRYGIYEPQFSENVVVQLDLIMVPGLAFDRQGNRIGMGKGYYDRFLAAHKKVPKVALAFAEQILDRVPKEPYDEPVHWIITEYEVIDAIPFSP